MRGTAKDFNPEDYSISEFYAYLDNTAIVLDREHALLDILVKYRNKDQDATEKQHLQWEVEAFLFQISGDRLFSFSTSTGANFGEVSEFPVLDDLQAAGLDYLKTRVVTAKSPLLLARYNHLLWKGLAKNKAFARDAVLAYAETIRTCLPDADPAKGDYLQISQLHERLVFLCGEVKEGIAEAKAITRTLLFDGAAPFYAKHNILKNMLAAKTVFRPADYTGCLAIFETELTREMDKGDPFLWTTSYFGTAMTIARKLGSGVSIWQERMGDCYAQIAARETQEDRNWMKYDMLTSAAQAYREAGNKEKKKAIEQLIFELKPKVKLPTIRIRRTEAEIKRLKAIDRFLEAHARELLKEPPEIVYASLIRGWIYPTKELTAKASEKEKFFYEQFLTPVFFDRNKNVRKDKTEDHSQKKFNDIYHHFVQSVTVSYLFYVFIPGIRSGHLTYRNFIAYLAEHTWLGKPYLKTDLGGNELFINWIPLLSPAIVDYFVQVQAWQLGTTYRPNFILSIDSLTLKMEGLFRNFSEQAGISTTVGSKDGLQEVYLHNVLDNPAVKAHFNEDDLQFFKYLFANEGGINLRNNVAHAFYHFTDYHMDKFHLLLAALIKIGQYTFSDRQSS